MPMLDSYIFFNGQCAEAMRFYEGTLGGKLETMMKYSEAPAPQQCPGAAGDAIMHASLLLDGRRLMASDMPPDMEYKPMAGFSLALNYPTAAEARRIFDALSQGGNVTMPVQKTFWAEAFGCLVDRFGTPWMVGGGLVQP